MSETTRGLACSCAGAIGHKHICPQCAPERYTATPPTPDLDAVREALVALAQSADWVAIDRLASALGVQETPATRFVGEAIADALLAAVSRPAEVVAQDGGSSVPTPEDLAFRRGVYAERAEWRKATGAAHWSEVSRPAEARGYEESVTRLGAFLVGKLTTEQWVEMAPLVEDVARAADSLVRRTHPAPSGGEGDKTLRDALVYAIERAVKSCAAQHDADVPPAAWIVDYAGILNAVQHKFPAAPRPEPGEPKVTDAMVDAVLDAMWEKPFTSADNAAMRVRWVLETALAAQRVQTP